MNEQQYLLIKMAEEASEITHIALKTAQFGMDSSETPQSLTNYQALHKELNDLLSIVSLLNTNYEFNFHPSKTAILEKQNKVQKYKEISASLGLVQLNTEKLITTYDSSQ